MTNFLLIQALITAQINPIEVEVNKVLIISSLSLSLCLSHHLIQFQARMTGLGLGLENLVGLIAIFEGNENTVS